MKTLPFLPYAKQSIQNEDIEAVTQALKEEWITRGPLVKLFEESVAAYCNVPYAVAFNSATSALAAAYFAAKLTPFDRVISTPNTFIATVGLPVQMDMRPRLVDLDRSTGNLDLQLLKSELDFRSSGAACLLCRSIFQAWQSICLR